MTKATKKVVAAKKPEVSVQAPPQKLNIQQEINALRAAHKFFVDFDRVPGSQASNWSQALDAIAVVANSLIAKSTPEESTEEASTAAPVESTKAPVEN